MRSFTEWIDQERFYIKDSYDPVTDEGGEVGPIVLFPWQSAIFDHVLTPDEDGLFPYTTFVYSTPKKGGKTACAAGIAGYFAEEYPGSQEIFMMANDKEQAIARSYKDLRFHFQLRNEQLPDHEQIEIYKSYSRLPSGTEVRPLAQEAASAAGSRHVLTVWDELWAYSSDAAKEMWSEMTQIKTPGVKQSIRLVVTYAGYEQDDPDSPLRRLYDMVVDEGKKGTNEFGGPPAKPVPELEHITDDNGNPVCWHKGKMFVYWDHVNRMPWMDEEYYEEQRANLTANQFLRLHKNQWVSGTETFVPIGWWDRAIKLEKPLVLDPQSPYRRHPLTIGVDVGYKQDSSAAVAVWHDPGGQEEPDITGIAAHKIWEPGGELEMHMENEIVSWILELAANANVSKVVCDPSNFYGGIIELRRAGLHVEEFNQQGSKMAYASSNLFSLLKNKSFVTYDAPDIRQHLLQTVATTTGRGYRIKKESSRGGNIDSVVALAMACYDIKQNHGVDTTEPLVFENIFHDQNDEDYERRKISEERAKEGIPMQLRDHMTREDKNRIWDEYEQSEAEPF